MLTPSLAMAVPHGHLEHGGLGAGRALAARARGYLHRLAGGCLCPAPRDSLRVLGRGA